jgi:hypothetical protein
MHFTLAPRINYSSCHDVAQLYSMRLHSGDMAHIRDTAPVIYRGFVIFEVRHAKKPQRRAPGATDGSTFPPFRSRKDALPERRGAYDGQESTRHVQPYPLGQQRRCLLLPTLRMPQGPRVILAASVEM